MQLFVGLVPTTYSRHIGKITEFVKHLVPRKVWNPLKDINLSAANSLKPGHSSQTCFTMFLETKCLSLLEKSIGTKFFCLDCCVNNLLKAQRVAKEN